MRATSAAYDGAMASTPVARTAQKTHVARPLRFLARAGYVVSGLLHALLGGIAIQLAVGTDRVEADQSGALGQLASAPAGRFVLWLAVIGFAALALWLLTTAVLAIARKGKGRVKAFVTDLVKAIVYAALALTALSFAAGGGTSSAQTTSSVSATLLRTPGGKFVIVLVGIAVFAVAVYVFVKGVTKRFKRDIQTPGGTVGEVTVALGVIGYVAKGIALGTVGVLFVVAALTADPAKANGLDAALRTLATLPFGSVILIVVGVGLIAYALYSFVRSRYARM